MIEVFIDWADGVGLVPAEDVFTTGEIRASHTYRTVGKRTITIVAKNQFGDAAQVSVEIEISATAIAPGGGGSGAVPTPTPKPPTTISDGTWIVGSQVSPGTYSNPGGSFCYWARLSGFGGSLDDIIANGISSDSQIVTISASDVGFESSGCGIWTLLG